VKLFSFFTEKNQMSIGVETAEGTYDLTQAFDIYQHVKRVPRPVSFAFLQVLVEMGYASSQTIEKILDDQWVRSKIEGLRLPENLRYDVPIARPSKVIAIGRNYADHVKELKHEMPGELCFFSKAPSSLTAHDSEIVIPQWLQGEVHYEAELALVIGKPAKNIAPEDAMMVLAGYTIVNDVTARTLQKSDIDRKNPWFRSKSLDTFCPVGPCLVPADALDDPHRLNISLSINGEVRQKGNTKLMLFKVPEIIAEISKYMTLQSGDIIATGTPAGVGPIQDGDEIEITITGLGKLRNRVRREQG
jgi:2-keto-4-pentenoate hydratase/2-oxohepta-3-ene-1,7-dioic acid hydratase in catechol pathway